MPPIAKARARPARSRSGGAAAAQEGRVDPETDIARRYDLTGADLGRLWRQVASELENRAVKSGYEEAWVDEEWVDR